MALYGAFSPSMMAMMSQSYALDIIGTNVANISTTGYKRSDVNFATVLSDNLQNLSDIGGVTANTFQRIDTQGPLASSSRQLDTAISGQGFYVLNTQIDGSGDTYYTRNGSFYTVAGDTITVPSDDGTSTITTEEAYLTDQNGYYVMGWQPSADGTISTSGTLSAQRVDSYAFASTGVSTSLATLDLNLPASDATGSSYVYSAQVFDDQGNEHIVNLNFTKLDANNTWTVTPSWQDVPVAQVETLTIGGSVEAGDQYTATVNGTTVTYTATGGEADMSAVRDGLLALLNANTNITGSVTVTASGTDGISLTASTPGTGFTSSAATSQGLSSTAQVDTLTIAGAIETGDIFTATINGTPVTYTTQVTDLSLADIRDGLIAAINLAGLGVTAGIGGADNLTITADVAGTPFTSASSTTDGGGGGGQTATAVNTTANYTALTDNTITDVTTTANSDGIQTGTATTLTFNSDGDLTGGTPIDLGINWSTAGTLNASLDLSAMSQYSGNFTLHTYSQNGFGAGFLEGISFDAQGQVIGSFTNGQDRPIYRLGLANFTNPNGLEALSGNIYRESPESGNAAIFAADSNSYASIAANSTEMSNVTIEDEFSKMILTQNAYNSASTVFRTVDEMITVARDLKR